MTRACSKGLIDGCFNNCLEPYQMAIRQLRLFNETFALNRHCDDEIHFGLKVWEKFVLEGEPYSDIRAIFNIKNSRLGMIVSKY